MRSLRPITDECRRKIEEQECRILTKDDHDRWLDPCGKECDGDYSTYHGDNGGYLAIKGEVPGCIASTIDNDRGHICVKKTQAMVCVSCPARGYVTAIWTSGRGSTLHVEGNAAGAGGGEFSLLFLTTGTCSCTFSSTRFLILFPLLLVSYILFP